MHAYLFLLTFTTYLLECEIMNNNRNHSSIACDVVFLVVMFSSIMSTVYC